MCGIAGYWKINSNASPDLPLLKKAVQQLNKRGPDFSNFFTHQNVALGHARLSIIDTSEAANQPFTDSSGNYTIIFNGEIYNHPYLRDQLKKEGINFRTRSDTEVLLELYKKHKQETPEKLNGFFAFAVFDKVRNEIFIARDRFGIKPLYYYQDQTQIAFASEIKALTELQIDKTPDYTSIHRYFQLNYIPGPRTIFKNVKQLKPGHCIIIKNDQISLTQYYKLPTKPTFEGGYQEAQQTLKSLMLKAVQRRLIADVPLGSFLSGGIDSSIIADITAKLNPNIESFSIGFPDEPYYDETHYAKAVAQKSGLKHHIIGIKSADMLNVLPDVLDYIDQPFADSSAIPFYILSNEIGKHVTVALSGDGADEIFGGYRKHMAHARAINKSIVNKLVKTAGPLLNLTPQSRHNKIADKARQAARFSKGIQKKGVERYWYWASISSPDYAQQLLKTPWPEQHAPWHDLGLDVPEKHTLGHILQADVNMLLPGDMLTKADSMSMANSLEVRVPFLDHELVEFAMQLPDHFKIHENKQKRILQDTFRTDLPAELYNRPKKGFEIPLVNWFRKDLYHYIFDDLLSEAKIEQQALLNYSVINDLKKQLLSSSPGDSPARIWALVVFQHWWNQYMN